MMGLVYALIGVIIFAVVKLVADFRNSKMRERGYWNSLWQKNKWPLIFVGGSLILFWLVVNLFPKLAGFVVTEGFIFFVTALALCGLMFQKAGKDEGPYIHN